MTKEKAKNIVRGITDKIETTTVDMDDWAEFWGFTRDEYEEFLDMAIKSLAQETILDKIRERIDLEKLGYPPSAGYYKAIIKVLQIIDKYRAESEGKG